MHVHGTCVEDDHETYGTRRVLSYIPIALFTIIMEVENYPK